MAHPERKKTFVDPQVQGALARRLCMHWVAFIAVAAAVAFCLQVLSNPFRPISEHVQQLWWTQGPFIMVMIFMMPVFVVDTIKISHRFAGPIYRLRQTVREMAESGEMKVLKFRDFDFWQGLADDFNRMTARLTGTEYDPSVAEADEEEVAEKEEGELVTV